MLAVLFLGGMIAACALVLYPFLSALIWATLLVASTWPLMRLVQRRLWGSRTLAVAVMTVSVLLVFIVPVALGVSTIVQNADQVLARVEQVRGLSVPPPPAWAREMPLIGPRLAQRWQDFSMLRPDELRQRLEPYRAGVTRWLLQQAGGLATFFLQLLLTVIIAAGFFLKGEAIAGGVCAFARRLAGPRGEEMTLLAAQAIRAVALGVIVTAAIETVLAGIGLYAARVPYAAFLTALVFIVALVGAPALVLLPVVIWLYWKGNSPLVATLFLAWSIVIAVVDNVLRPVFIRKTVPLPLALIFAGVIGGVIAFGAMGLFIGPVVLAVSYTLLSGWVKEAS